MSADVEVVSFVDTNVLVYALAADDPQRSHVAQQLVRELMESNVFRTSTQVLQELFVTLTRKIRTPMKALEALRYLDQLAEWPVAVLEYRAVRDAIHLAERAKISFWDALIVIAAARSGAMRLYTEDLHDGQTLLGVTVMNPFRGATKARR